MYKSLFTIVKNCGILLEVYGNYLQCLVDMQVETTISCMYLIIQNQADL